MEHIESEFEKVHQLFRPKVLRYLARLVGKHEAEDLTQEVFVRVARGLRDFRGIGGVSLSYPSPSIGSEGGDTP